MVSKGKIKKMTRKASKPGIVAKGKAALSGAASLFGGGKSARVGGKRRNRGPTYWANKVLVAKLQKKYRAIKYGGTMR